MKLLIFFAATMKASIIGIIISIVTINAFPSSLYRLEKSTQNDDISVSTESSEYWLNFQSTKIRKDVTPKTTPIIEDEVEKIINVETTNTPPMIRNPFLYNQSIEKYDSNDSFKPNKFSGFLNQTNETTEIKPTNTAEQTNLNSSFSVNIESNISPNRFYISDKLYILTSDNFEKQSQSNLKGRSIGNQTSHSSTFPNKSVTTDLSPTTFDRNSNIIRIKSADNNDDTNSDWSEKIIKETTDNKSDKERQQQYQTTNNSTNLNSLNSTLHKTINSDIIAVKNVKSLNYTNTEFNNLTIWKITSEGNLYINEQQPLKQQQQQINSKKHTTNNSFVDTELSGNIQNGIYEYMNNLNRSKQILQNYTTNNYIRRKKEAHIGNYFNVQNRKKIPSINNFISSLTSDSDITEDLSSIIPGVYYHKHDPLTGKYSFRYRTDNQWREETRNVGGVVRGSYGWTDAFGRSHITRYIADDQGYRLINKGEQVSTYISPPPNFSHSSSNNLQNQEIIKQRPITNHPQYSTSHVPEKPNRRPALGSSTSIYHNTHPIPIHVHRPSSQDQVPLGESQKLDHLNHLYNIEDPVTGRPAIAHPLPNIPIPYKPTDNWSSSNQLSGLHNWPIKNINNKPFLNTVNILPHIAYAQNKNPIQQQSIKVPNSYQYGYQNYANQHYINSHIPGYIYPQMNPYQSTYPGGYFPGLDPNINLGNYQSIPPYPLHTYIEASPNFPLSNNNNIYQLNQNPFQQPHHHLPGFTNSHDKISNNIYNLKPLNPNPIFPFQTTNPTSAPSGVIDNNQHNYNVDVNAMKYPVENQHIDGNSYMQTHTHNNNHEFINNFLEILNKSNLTITKRPPSNPINFPVSQTMPWTSSVIKLPQRPFIPIPSSNFPIHHPNLPSLDYDFLPEDIFLRDVNYDESPMIPNSIQDIIENLMNEDKLNHDNIIIPTESPIIQPHPLKPSRLGGEISNLEYLGNLKWKIPVVGQLDKIEDYSVKPSGFTVSPIPLLKRPYRLTAKPYQRPQNITFVKIDNKIKYQNLTNSLKPDLNLPPNQSHTSLLFANPSTSPRTNISTLKHGINQVNNGEVTSRTVLKKKPITIDVDITDSNNLLTSGNLFKQLLNAIFKSSIGSASTID